MKRPEPTAVPESDTPATWIRLAPARATGEAEADDQTRDAFDPPVGKPVPVSRPEADTPVSTMVSKPIGATTLGEALAEVHTRAVEVAGSTCSRCR